MERERRHRASDEEKTLEVREERLTSRREMVKRGEVLIRKMVEEVPGRLEVDARREEVQVEHVPVGKVVGERSSAREEDGVLIIPVYEEQLVVSKQLVLVEELRVRRVASKVTRVFEDTLRKERVTIDDPDRTGAVREHYPTEPGGSTEQEDLDEEGTPRNVPKRAIG